MATIDPRRIADQKDAWVTALYAKTVGETADDDVLPLIIDSNGYLLVNMTVGTITLSSTASTITNAVGNPVNVSLTSTKVTIESAGLNVTPTTTASTITNAAGNPVNVSLTNTLVTVNLSPTTVTVAGTVSLTTTAVTASLANSGVTISLGRSLSSSSGTVTATQVTLVLAGSNKTKVYAFSLTTTSTTGVIASFMHGSQSGPELWRVLLQAPSGANSGANLAVSPPTWLFATPSAGNLILFLSTSVRVDYSIAWFDEA